MALPGLRGTEHIGFTVPDLDQAERFFVDVIGCELVYSVGPFVTEGDWMKDQMNVHPRAVMAFSNLKYLILFHSILILDQNKIPTPKSRLQHEFCFFVLI